MKEEEDQKEEDEDEDEDEDIFALSKSTWHPRTSFKSKGGITAIDDDNDFDNDSLAFSQSGATDFFRSRAFSLSQAS